MSTKNTLPSSEQGDPATDNPEQESQNNSNKMWGGRFSQAPDSLMETINASIGFDQRGTFRMFLMPSGRFASPNQSDLTQNSP